MDDFLRHRRLSVMVLMAVIAAAFAVVTFVVGFSRIGPGPSLLAATLLLLSPLVSSSLTSVMADILVAVFFVVAAVSFARYMDSVRCQDGLAFGVWASVAIMIKGNAVALALLPPIAIALRRQWALVAKPSLWLSALVVVVLCGPWYVFIANKNGMLGTVGLDYTTTALSYYTDALLRVFGIVLLPVACVGIWRRIVAPAWRGTIDSFWASSAALVAPVYLFQIIVPIGWEDRYWISALPALALVLAAGADDIGGWLPIRRTGALIAVFAIFAVAAFRLPVRTPVGFSEAARSIIENPEWRNSAVLVTSTVFGGEGSFVSNMAMRSDLDTRYVLRATKVLSHSDLFGRNYRTRFNTPQSLMEFCRTVPIGLIVVDKRVGPLRRHAHHSLVQRMLAQYTSEWELIGRFPSDAVNPEILLYHQVGHENLPRAGFSIDLTDRIGRILSSN